MNKLDLAKSYWRAEADGDLETVLEHFAETARFTAPGFDLRGRDGIRRFYEQMMGGYASMRIEVLRSMESGDDLVVEFGFHFTRHSGGEGYAEGCNVFTFDGNLFTRVCAYFNPADY